MDYFCSFIEEEISIAYSNEEGGICHWRQNIYISFHHFLSSLISVPRAPGACSDGGGNQYRDELGSFSSSKVSKNTKIIQGQTQKTKVGIPLEHSVKNIGERGEGFVIFSGFPNNGQCRQPMGNLILINVYPHPQKMFVLLLKQMRHAQHLEKQSNVKNRDAFGAQFKVSCT